MDYIITGYTPGEFGHVSFDFVMKKGDGIEKDKEIAQTNYETVYKDFNIIINTRSAALNLTIFDYPICKDGSTLLHNPVSDSTEIGLHLYHEIYCKKFIKLLPGDWGYNFIFLHLHFIFIFLVILCLIIVLLFAKSSQTGLIDWPY